MQGINYWSKKGTKSSSNAETALVIAIAAGICLSIGPIKEAFTAANVPQDNSPLKNLSVNKLFEGGSDSVVAIAIGNAEGTRSVDGQKTRAWYGHTDPGNKVHNIGTFSFQHFATSAQDADRLQLEVLRQQNSRIDRLALQHKITLTMLERINALDLANQAPQAALDAGGFIEHLSAQKRKGVVEEVRIIEARTRAFINPVTQAYNAPGLGNTTSLIKADQARRYNAIKAALKRHS